MTDPSPDQRKRTYQAQFRVSGTGARAVASAISALLALLIFALIASLAFKMRDPQAKSLFALLIFMLILVAGIGSVLLGVRRFLEKLAGSAFQKGSPGNAVSFKWTVGPVITKTRVLHNLSELPAELANNPEVQQFLHRPEVQKLLERQHHSTFATSEPQTVIDVSGTATADSTPLESPADPSVPRAELRVTTISSDLPPEIEDSPEMKAFLGPQPSARRVYPRNQSPQGPDILKWVAIMLGFIVLVLGSLLLILYLRSIQH